MCCYDDHHPVGFYRQRLIGSYNVALLYIPGVGQKIDIFVAVWSGLCLHTHGVRFLFPLSVEGAKVAIQLYAFIEVNKNTHKRDEMSSEYISGKVLKYSKNNLIQLN